METFWKEAGDTLLRVGVRVLAGGLLLFIGFRIARWLTRSIQKKHVTRKGADPLTPTMRSFLASAVGIALRAGVVIVFIIIMGANTSSVVAMLSSAALAIGLALQNSFSNLAGGLLIILFKPFAIGDYITVGGESGTVRNINIYFTHIITPDNRTVVLPVAYAADARRVCALLEQAAAADGRVLADPKPQAALTDLTGGVQTYTVWAWCARTDYLDVTYELRAHAKEVLEQEGISLARARFDVALHD